MRRLFQIAAALMAAAVVLSGPACSDSKMGREAGSASFNSSEAEKRVKNSFSSDPRLRGFELDVSADPGKKEVTITGTVNSQEMRERAVRITRGELPGFVVNDNIDVMPREMARSAYGDRQSMERGREEVQSMPKGDSNQDAGIRSRIEIRFAGSNMSSLQNVAVDVENGIVTLQGFVTSPEEKMEAARLAEGIEGVRRVDNRLQVSGQGFGSYRFDQYPAH